MVDIKRPQSRQTIPSHAKQVFKGIIFEAWQWQQPMFDGPAQTFEKLKRSDTVNVIPVTSQGKIVLGRQNQPGVGQFVGVFGGRIDDGENPEQAARRELLEETGMEAVKLILWDSGQLYEKIDWAYYTFIAKDCQKVKDPHLDAGEKIETFEVSFDQFVELAAQENFRDTEISLKLFRLSQNKAKFQALRNLILL